MEAVDEERVHDVFHDEAVHGGHDFLAGDQVDDFVGVQREAVDERGWFFRGVWFGDASEEVWFGDASGEDESLFVFLHDGHGDPVQGPHHGDVLDAFGALAFAHLAVGQPAVDRVLEGAVCLGRHESD